MSRDSESQGVEVRAVIVVRGRVQGVGFRWWTRARALELGLSGHARNMPDRRVEVDAQGTPEAVRALITLLEEGEPTDSGRPGQVSGTSTEWLDLRPGTTGFRAR